MALKFSSNGVEFELEENGFILSMNKDKLRDGEMTLYKFLVGAMTAYISDPTVNLNAVITTQATLNTKVESLLNDSEFMATFVNNLTMSMDKLTSAIGIVKGNNQKEEDTTAPKKKRGRPKKVLTGEDLTNKILENSADKLLEKKEKSPYGKRIPYEYIQKLFPYMICCYEHCTNHLTEKQIRLLISRNIDLRIIVKKWVNGEASIDDVKDVLNNMRFYCSTKCRDAAFDHMSEARKMLYERRAIRKQMHNAFKV